MSTTPTRQCGDCQLCCELLPVRAVNKGAGVKCQHQQFRKGCTIHDRLWHVSPECRLWNCRWLLNDDAADLRRPDRSHYVIDIMPEYVTAGHVDGVKAGPTAQFRVVQIWVDPAHRDAHRDPALRDWLERQKGWAGLVRYSGTEGFVIFPPNMSKDGQWHEVASVHNGASHSAADLVQAFGWDALGGVTKQ